MAAEGQATLRAPHNVSEGRQLLSRAIGTDKIADHYGVDEETIDSAIRRAMAESTTGERFIFEVVWDLLKRFSGLGLSHEELEASRRALDKMIKERAEKMVEERARTEATPMASPTNDLLALGREVSGLDAKVNILLGLAGTLLVGLIAGAIGLWQAIGGVETRLARELGQAETRVTQQIADVRSEVGEIRGRLSVIGQTGSTPPPR